MMNLWTLIALAAAPAAPAHPDLTAIFAPAGSTKAVARVEVGQNGNGRMDLGEVSIIKRDDRLYLVITKQSPPMVLDMAALQGEARRSPGNDICRDFEAAASKAKLVRQGSFTVRGREGDAWFKLGPDGRALDKPEVVVSHDPALARLGAFLAEEYRVTTGMMPNCPALQAMVAPVGAALSSGTGILFSGMELIDVREGAVDPRRFELPAPPMSPEAMRKKGEQVTVRPKPD